MSRNETFGVTKCRGALKRLAFDGSTFAPADQQSLGMNRSSWKEKTLKEKYRNRQAFALIELLGSDRHHLMGLLLPAIQKVREAMLKVECAINLRQLALAATGAVAV